MKPTSRENIVNLTSKKLNLDNELVDTVIVSFYSFLNGKLASLEHTHINVSGLGMFKVRKKKVKDHIVKQEKIISMLEHKTAISMAKYSTLQDAKDKLEKLKNVLECIEEQESLKKEIKEKRKNE